MGVCLFVYHLPPDCNEQTLNALFCNYGTVTNVRIMRDLRTNLSKGFGFVNMLTAEQAQLVGVFPFLGDAISLLLFVFFSLFLQAIERLNGFQLGNKFLKVSMKTSKS
jgi:RNA recognition motif-containing protein